MLLTYRDVTEVFVDMRGTLENVAFRRSGCRETASDIAQDLFFKLDRLTARFATRHDARCFLIRMTLNATHDHYLVERRRAELLAESLPEPAAQDDPERAADRTRMLARLDRALDGLPPKCRDVLYLARIEGLTHGEIAERLGVSRSLVDKYAVRALLHCRAALAERA